MKAMTLTQPWASLVAIGAKRIETRSWGTNYRGPLAIHAAKGLTPVGGLEGLKDLCQTPPFCDELLAAGIHFATDLPRGGVLAVCALVTCIRLDDDLTVRDVLLLPSAAPHERAFGDYSVGRFAWVLADVQRLPDPLSARGALGLWDWQESPNLLAMLSAGGE